MLSTGLGRIVPNLISRKHTNSAATGISYLCFGAMNWEAFLGFLADSTIVEIKFL